jgi:hypothetical protein
VTTWLSEREVLNHLERGQFEVSKTVRSTAIRPTFTLSVGLTDRKGNSFSRVGTCWLENQAFDTGSDGSCWRYVGL